MAKVKEVGTKTLLIYDSKGKFKTEIPADAKITFGPAYPAAGKDYGGAREYALRVYQGTKDNIIAVFLGVRDFRYDGIPVWREIVKEAGKTMWKSDELGYKVEHEIKREKYLELDSAAEKF